MANFDRGHEQRWREKSHLRMPTYRQVNYWASHGAFGSERQDVGSGHWRKWTPHERLKLAALCDVMDDLHHLGMNLTIEVVRRLWELLDQSSTAILRVGSIAITASLPETGEPQ